MRWFSPMAGLVTLTLLVCFPCLVRADEPAADDPIRLLPASVEVVVKIDNARAVVDAIYKNEAFQGLLKLEPLASYYDNTQFRRLFQLLTHFEKQLGHDRYELLDRLAGRGGAFGLEINAGISVKVGDDPKEKKNETAVEGKPAAILVLAAKDEQVLTKAFKLFRELLDQELDRQESKAKLTMERQGDVEIWRLGKEFSIAQSGANLIVTNKEKLLRAALAQQGKDKGGIVNAPNFQQSETHRPKDALAWLWLDFKKIRAIPGFKTGFDVVTLDPQFVIIAGGLIDVMKRSDYVCASIRKDGADYLATIAMPKGREGMSKASTVVLPNDKNGSLPMLMPPRVIVCDSYFLDLGAFWDNRKEILNDKQAEALEKFEKQSAFYLGGVKIGTLLKQAGKYHRVIVADQDKSAYKVKPATPISAFAIVLDMRDPAFGKSMNTILRGAALIAGFQYGLRLVEEKHGKHTIVTYYFPEDKKLAGDENNVRFNFSPCFTEVGDQLIISSTLELARDLLDLVEKENRSDTVAATSRVHVYAKGVADNIKKSEEQLLAQYVLGQGFSAKAAKQQVRDLADLVGTLGELRFETLYGQNEFRFDVRWQMEKKRSASAK